MFPLFSGIWVSLTRLEEAIDLAVCAFAGSCGPHSWYWIDDPCWAMFARNSYRQGRRQLVLQTQPLSAFGRSM